MSAQLGLLDYLMLHAPDVRAVVDFYRDHLDAGVVEEAYPHWARIRLANVDIGIHQGAGAAGEGARAAFRVADMPAFRAHLEARGVPMQGDYHDIPGGVRLAFRDPAGNVLHAVRWGQSAADLVEG